MRVPSDDDDNIKNKFYEKLGDTVPDVRLNREIMMRDFNGRLVRKIIIYQVILGKSTANNNSKKYGYQI